MCGAVDIYIYAITGKAINNVDAAMASGF